MKRGMLTAEIKSKSKELLGYEIDQTELRLMPYVDFVMKNERAIDPNRVNPAERSILQKWREAGHIEGGASGLAITKHFFEVINEILWLGYVTYDN